jgi:hypothetical protein
LNLKVTLGSMDILAIFFHSMSTGYLSISLYHL